MPIPDHLAERLTAIHVKAASKKGPAVKRGPEIFEGTDYPTEWDLFVGQEEAKEQLQAAIASARARGKRLDHVLLASGLHGIGKTTLAMLIAAKMDAGLVSVSGAMGVEEARQILNGMQDGDVLFWDEIHLAVAGNRNRADWMLPLLTDGVLMTARGAEQMPDVTVIAATTDLGKLQETLISRFPVPPKLVPYTDDEAEDLVFNLGERMGVWIEPKHRPAVAKAASNNPRAMRKILTAVRDLSYVSTPVDMAKAFRWAGFEPDGLGVVAVDMLLVLLGSPECTASIDSIQAQLGEPGPLRHHEQTLLQRALITITGRGRQLTDEGRERAVRAIHERSS